MKTVVSSLTLVSLLLSLSAAQAATFNLLQEYKGDTWFDDWNFYADEGVWDGVTPWDNSTVGAWSSHHLEMLCTPEEKLTWRLQ